MAKPASIEQLEDTETPPSAQVATTGNSNAPGVSSAPSTAPAIDALDVLEALTGSIEAPADWAAEHDHYLYGTPKRGKTET